MSTDLQRALAIHDSAAKSFVDVVRRTDVSRWHAPIADGKWTPSEIAEHLILAYETLNGELRGGPGMRIRTKWWQRVMLRMTLVPRLLAGRPFPKGAIAPREARPVGRKLEKEAAIETFEQRARELVELARAAGPKQRLTHAYFGKATVADGVLLCARHIEHHTAQL